MDDQPPKRYVRKVIHIAAEDSPNVAYALKEIEAGKEPSGAILIPGVIDYFDYKMRLKKWDAEAICIGIKGRFYESKDNKLYPVDWIQHAEQLATTITNFNRKPVAMGIDPGEGSAKSSWSVVDEVGLIDLNSFQTPNTSDIVKHTIGLIKKYSLHPQQVLMDRGGGGKQHADRLRELGYDIRTISFGGRVRIDPTRPGVQGVGIDAIEAVELKWTYASMRAQMYGEFREMLDPYAYTDQAEPRFALPQRFKELRRQMEPIPLIRDNQGRITIPPKNPMPGYKGPTLLSIIGKSPDELESTILAVHGLLHPVQQLEMGIE